MLDLFIVLFCLAVNAVFSAFEMAFITVSKEDVEDYPDEQKNVRRRLGLFKRNPERTLSVIQIGITLVGAIAAAVGGTGAVENLEPYLVEKFEMNRNFAEALSVTTVIVPLTYFSVVLGELVPKTIALRYPNEVLSFGTALIFIVDKLLSPVVTFLERSTSFILSSLRMDKEEEDEIPETVAIGKLAGYHRKFVYNLVGLRSKKVKSVMVPWEKVSFLDFGLSDEEVRNIIREKHRSRFPVIDGDVLVGLFHVKEWKESPLVPWQSILGPALTVSPDDKVIEVFLKMQEGNHHLAVVRDNTKFCGILTIEDFFEQIVGSIRDDLERNRIARLLSYRSRLPFRK